MAENNRSIRLAQTISPFGVGAIYDIMGESFVLCDTSFWRIPEFSAVGRKINHELLASSIGVHHFHEARSKASFFESTSGKLPFFRFPRWLFCPVCRRMYYWSPRDENQVLSPRCAACKGERKLVPMRFIAICEQGHMDDVHWNRWVHSVNKSEGEICNSKDLRFLTFSGKGGGLKSVAISCVTCNAVRTLSGITTKDCIRSIGQKCSGKQPWQSKQRSVPCSCTPQIVQRGASNVYYPQIKSGLSIPQRRRHSDDLDELSERIKENKLFNVILDSNYEDKKLEQLYELIAEEINCEAEEVKQQYLKEKEIPDPDIVEVDIEKVEWQAFVNPSFISNSDEFILDIQSLTTKSDDFPNRLTHSVASRVNRIIAVKRLREVRVLEGFYRYKPGGNPDGAPVSHMVPVSAELHSNWLPAIEVFGEGVFFSLDEAKLNEWENIHEVKLRAQGMEMKRKKSALSYILPKVSPRYLLLHTLSHLLIRQLAFECGYSSASLRERIYCNNDEHGDTRAGILIYTSAGDTEGTLGGLARQAKPPRFFKTLLNALQQGYNCSADPICLESNGQGLEGLNMAACHACALVSETSCTAMNLLLDRVMVTGDTSDEVVGFFNAPLQIALENSARNTRS